MLGDGKLGNLCAQVLRLTGAKVTALGKHADKLALIKKAGVRTIQLNDWQPRLFDVVVEATGSASGLELALCAVRPRGTLVLKSTIAGNHQVSLAPIVINEINVIGSRCGPFPDALAALAAKQVSVTPLIDKIYALNDGFAAVAHAARPGARKILLSPCKPMWRAILAGAMHAPDQNDDPGSARKANSSAVDSRPRILLRCGKRPKRAMISRWRIAKSRYSSKVLLCSVGTLAANSSSIRPILLDVHATPRAPAEVKENSFDWPKLAVTTSVDAVEAPRERF